MRRLPLFPLPTVLLPGARMPLHIFESRYRRLVARSLEEERAFGIVRHDPDVMGPFIPEEAGVGCSAEIEAHKLLPDGRSLILVRGVERFEARDGIESDEPYYEAVVAPYTDRPGDSERLELQRRRTRALFDAALDALSGEHAALPDGLEGETISFVLASLLRIDDDWKQAFLELRSETQRLERLDAIFKAAADPKEA